MVQMFFTVGCSSMVGNSSMCSSMDNRQGKISWRKNGQAFTVFSAHLLVYMCKRDSQNKTFQTWNSGLFCRHQNVSEQPQSLSTFYLWETWGWDWTISQLFIQRNSICSCGFCLGRLYELEEGSVKLM